MKFYMQETKHNPPESYGDCVRTCVACLLDREPLTVPNFFDPRNCGDDPWSAMEEWLRDAGFASVKMHVGGDLTAFLRYMQTLNPGVLYMLCGNGHAVVACGNAVIHDPSWLKLGVSEPELVLMLVPALMAYTGE